MALLIFGLLLFTLVHLVPAAFTSLRTSLIGRLGENPYRGLFSLVIVISLVLAIVGIPLPDLVFDMINPLAQMTAPLILITLGIFFTLDLKDLKLVGLTVFIRMGMGLLFGIAVANYLGLSETTFIVVSLCAAAPVGFNALTFSSIAKLDAALSSSAVSISILAGLIYIPLLMLYFGVP